MSGAAELPDEAWALAFASLPGVSAAQVRAAVTRLGPREAFERALQGRPVLREGEVSGGDADEAGSRPPVSEVPVLFPEPERPERGTVLRRRAQAARHLDVADFWRQHRQAGFGVALLGDPGYPAQVAADPHAPGLLVWSGDIESLAHPRAGMVGTRRCTRYGRDQARSMGEALSAAGVSVVSGLAWGIDGAAHEGALRADGAPPVAVVGCGLDQPYPRRHRDLWGRVAEGGVVLSEWPMGAEPLPWRFPLRNRIIAALSPVLVVVESHQRGGSLSTVEEADQRGHVVLAVPGPVTSPASSGTNQLVYDGAGLARHAGDVLVALGLSAAVPSTERGDPDTEVAGASTPVVTAPPGTEAVHSALTGGPATVDQIAVRAGCTLEEAASALARLDAAGLVSSSAGWWEARTDPHPRVL